MKPIIVIIGDVDQRNWSRARFCNGHNERLVQKARQVHVSEALATAISVDLRCAVCDGLQGLNKAQKEFFERHQGASILEENVLIDYLKAIWNIDLKKVEIMFVVCTQKVWTNPYFWFNNGHPLEELCQCEKFVVYKSGECLAV